ncbi:MAG: prolyl hydroxylase family protein [Maricaulaceae bacterium]
MGGRDVKYNTYEAMRLLGGNGSMPKQSDFDAAFLKFETAQSIPFAKAKLAVMYALGCGTSQNFDKAQDLFFEAVMSGFPPLLRDMSVILDGCHIGMNGLSCGLLRRATASGDEISKYLWKGLQKRGEFVEPTPIDTKVIRSAIAEIFKPQITVEQDSLSETHPISAVKSALTPLQCDYLRAVSQPFMQPSLVAAGGRGAIQANYRTSDGAVLLPVNMDMPLLQILWQLSSMAGVKPEQGEFLSLLRYHPGQEYRPHHDYLPVDEKDYAQIGRAGQRSQTVLTYLNANYSGGATHFPELNVRFKGEVGDSLVFANTDLNGMTLPKSMHAGEPVEAGEKWLATLWIRERRFWPWAKN